MSPADHRQRGVLRHYWAAAGLFGMVLVGLAGVMTGGNWVAVAVGAFLFALISAFAAKALRLSYPHDRLGGCNLVTLARAALVGVLMAVAWAAPSGIMTWPVLALAVFTLCLDGVDGQMARRSGLVSTFGARFDMEVDCVLALVLALLALQTGKVGAWVLVLGGMRYLFIAAAVIWPWLNGPLPERFGRKLVCVVQIGTLIALAAPVVTPPLALWLAAVATALLVWSFALDIVWLARNHR